MRTRFAEQCRRVNALLTFALCATARRDLQAGLMPPEITDAATDEAARADAWPLTVTFIQQPGTSK